MSTIHYRLRTFFKTPDYTYPSFVPLTSKEKGLDSLVVYLENKSITQFFYFFPLEKATGV